LKARTLLRISFAAACASIALGAVPATAAVYFVDGACATSGTGASLGCGPTGPFRTIAEGILALQPGDTLNIRGAHDGFDGIYFESLAVKDDAPVPGKALACASSQRCVIQGCRSPACPTDEQPTIRGMTRRSDWVAQGGGVYSRTMEATPNPDPPLARDDFDPTMLMQGSVSPLTMLAYAGDDVAAPADGTWSYFPATHRISVNPAGASDPAATVYVPHFGYHLQVQSPSSYVTVQYVTFEGTRGKSVEIESLPPDQVTGVVLSHLIQRYVPHYFVHTSRGAPRLVIEDTISEYGGRGVSWARPISDAVFGYRLFAADAGVMRRNVVRHLGATGRIRLSCGPTCTNVRPCPWCDPPWNDPGHTEISTSGTAYQVKQTDGFLIEDNVAEDISTIAIDLDVSRDVVVQDNTVARAGSGISMRNFTPTQGCPTTDPSEFCYSSGHIIRRNVVTEAGRDDANICAVEVIGGSTRHTGEAPLLARVYNNFISRVGSVGICIMNNALDLDGSTPTTGVRVFHNTIYGARAGAANTWGIIVRDAAQDVVLRNNALDALGDDGLVVASAAAGGVSLDGDVVGTVGGCQVRWGVPAFSSTPSGGSCDTLAAHERNGRTGALRFANPGATPPDLHLTSSSVAIEAANGLYVQDDIDGEVRPQGARPDSGADEFVDDGSGGGTNGSLVATEFRCQQKAATSSWKALAYEAACVATCSRRARAGTTPPADCASPFGHATAACVARAKEQAARRMCTACNADAPECYEALCPQLAGTKIATIGTEFDTRFLPALRCDDSGSADGLTTLEGICQDAVLNRLGRFVAWTAKCLAHCRKAEFAGRIPVGSCAPTSLTDPTGWTQACIDRISRRTVANIDARCSVGSAFSGDAPECHNGRLGADWVAFAVSRIAAQQPVFYCDD
jgi:hypothetical protein